MRRTGNMGKALDKAFVLIVFAITIANVLTKLRFNLDWSWWWVLSPLWIGGILIALAHLIVYFGERKYREDKQQ
jgi:TRAP-type C4-dicarboxylate transport system permease small subunit